MNNECTSSLSISPSCSPSFKYNTLKPRHKCTIFLFDFSALQSKIIVDYFNLDSIDANNIIQLTPELSFPLATFCSLCQECKVVEPGNA